MNRTEPPVANTEQAEAWNGYEGEHWARHQDRWNAVNDGFNEPLLNAAAIGAGDRVLDVGCGSGRTTRLAARRAGDGAATGLDLSGPMLARAREAADREGVANAAFVQGDAQVHPFEPASFDRAVSRFGVMFFADPAAAFGAIGRAVRPGGRLAFVCPADPDGNDWLTVLSTLKDLVPMGGIGAPGQPGMFSLADPAAIRAVLAAAGWTNPGVHRVEAYGEWGADAGDVAAFMAGMGPGRHLLGRLDPGQRAEAGRRLTEALRRYERPDGPLRLRSTAWLVTAERPE
ncbi:SAM-dependent methyltransferase [Streptomyces solincola]|uniref:SAM-dependent methyltransferase n=1 Tax=Streptomyces solincola TaxID=2100817 RepID=A0A2S9PRW8_9ACTN|nr:class I SAM-dependent methyltransferase [Streptomyces solincola]PRH77170.1 SAM-dependent methyltransferase [Streptomyces solincola]